MLLHIENLSAGYGQLRVLNNVSLSVGVGEMVVLIGPNGAGKSTILKSIFGLTTKMNGQILFDALNITSLPTHSLIEQGIGFVPQGRLIFPTMTVKENLEIGGYLIDHKETLHKSLDYVFGLFSVLKEKQQELAGNLSGGQQQQLAIGRALMMRPKLLMLDEPSLGLSPKLTQEVFHILQKIREEGTTLLIVEQNVRLALSYVDRGHLLSNGKIIFSGTAKELGDEKIMHNAYLS
ncbi:ABC transporter ATP-binding protein [Candidatus Uhrbacteria bacterium]|nr:ABC transporter ATP-binding protein [Candidatus Uhrbacteria bacterium]